MAAQAASGVTAAARKAAMVLQRDRALTVFTKDVRLAVLRCTSCVNTGASRFQVAQSQAAALYAKALASSMLLSCFNKGEERVIMDFSAFAQDAPVTRICAESMRVGEVRGFIHGSAVGLGVESSAEFDGLLGLPSPNPDSSRVQEAFRGKLEVHQVLYGQAKPRTSVVPCVVGDIVGDVNFLLAQSDQTAGAVHVEAVPGDPVGTHAFVGGVFVQLLAGGDEAVLQRVRASLEQSNVSLAASHAAGDDLPVIAQALLPELELEEDKFGRKRVSQGALGVRSTAPSSAEEAVAVLEGAQTGLTPQTPLDFYCRCSKKGFVTQLGRLPAEELASMAAEDPLPALTCQFCNEEHKLTAADFEALLAPARDTQGAITSDLQPPASDR